MAAVASMVSAVEKKLNQWPTKCGENVSVISGWRRENGENVSGIVIGRLVNKVNEKA